MIKHKSLHRTTMAQLDDLPNAGIYIIAYMGKVIYVGKATDSVMDRIRTHLLKAIDEPFGYWLENMRFDWPNVRVDVLEAPDNIDIQYWSREVEGSLVRRLNPLFNQQLT